MDNGYFKDLAVPLPEDVEKLKWRGDLEQAARVIDLRLQRELPEPLKRRLLLEKEILVRLPRQYPYTWDQALEILGENVRDFKNEELAALWEEDEADWIYVGGQVHFRSSFLKNVLKTRKNWETRALNPELVQAKADNFALLDKTIQEMQEKGGIGCWFQISVSMWIKEEAEREGEMIRVHLPLPIEYAQIHKVIIHSVKIGGKEAAGEAYSVAPPEAPQRTICFHTRHHRGQSYQVEFSFENHCVYRNLHTGTAGAGSPAKCDVHVTESNYQTRSRAAGYAGPGKDRGEKSGGGLFLGEQLPHIRFTPYIKGLVAEIVGKEDNALLKAERIYDYITTHVMYSYVRSYFTLTDIVQYAASSLKGDCGVQALLFITMCRAAGVPARWQGGLYATPLEISCHDWAQFYAEPFGWLYADCSYGGAAWREGHENRWKFYFGNLDPFRLPAAREFGYGFIPPMDHLRNDPYDNQTGEAEYGDRSLLEEEYETVFEMKQIKPLPF